MCRGDLKFEHHESDFPAQRHCTVPVWHGADGRGIEKGCGQQAGSDFVSAYGQSAERIFAWNRRDGSDSVVFRDIGHGGWLRQLRDDEGAAGDLHCHGRDSRYVDYRLGHLPFGSRRRRRMGGSVLDDNADGGYFRGWHRAADVLQKSDKTSYRRYSDGLCRADVRYEHDVRRGFTAADE